MASGRSAILASRLNAGASSTGTGLRESKPPNPPGRRMRPLARNADLSAEPGTASTIPRDPHGTVVRPRLDQLLETGQDYPVTLICAPAGSGKVGGGQCLGPQPAAARSGRLAAVPLADRRPDRVLVLGHGRIEATPLVSARRLRPQRDPPTARRPCTVPRGSVVLDGPAARRNDAGVRRLRGGRCGHDASGGAVSWSIGFPPRSI